VLYDLGDYAVDSTLRNDLGVLVLWRPGGRLEVVGLHLDFCRTDLAAGEHADWIAGRLQLACGELGAVVRRLDEARFAIDSSEV
jgi:hypothetical protein